MAGGWCCWCKGGWCKWCKWPLTPGAACRRLSKAPLVQLLSNAPGATGAPNPPPTKTIKLFSTHQSCLFIKNAKIIPTFPDLPKTIPPLSPTQPYHCVKGAWLTRKQNNFTCSGEGSKTAVTENGGRVVSPFPPFPFFPLRKILLKTGPIFNKHYLR